MKKGKQLGTLFLAFAMLLCPVCACAYEEDNSTPLDTEASVSNDSVVTVSEYEMYIASKLSDVTMFSTEVPEYYNTEYILRLKTLTQYSEDELDRMGYSDGNIAIIEELKKNPSYVPTSEELAAASATLQFTFVCSDTYMRETETYFDFIWWFRWSDTPTQTYTDAVVAHWLDDFFVDETTVEAEVEYSSVTLDGEDILVIKDLSTKAKNGIMPNENACEIEIPLNITKTVDGKKYQLMGYEGSGSFRLMCDLEAHSNIHICWKYGHSSYGVTDVEVSFSDAVITFGPQTTTLAEGDRTFYVN